MSHFIGVVIFEMFLIKQGSFVFKYIDDNIDSGLEGDIVGGPNMAQTSVIYCKFLDIFRSIERIEKERQKTTFSLITHRPE